MTGDEEIYKCKWPMWDLEVEHESHEQNIL